MATVSITAPNISADWDRGSVIYNAVAAVALTIGQVVYLDSSNQAHPAKADSAAHATTVGIVVGAPNFYGETTVNIGDYAAVCVSGPVYGFTGLVNGETLYVDKTTAGNIVDVAPTGAYQYAIGNALGADTIFVRPGITTPVSA